jgi:hypothetical protein
MDKIAEMYIVSIFAGAMVALFFFGIVFFVDQYFMDKDKKQHKD